MYYSRVVLSGNQGAAKKYNNKDHGPPHYRYSAEIDTLEHSEILQANGVTPEEVRHPAAQARIAPVETA